MSIEAFMRGWEARDPAQWVSNRPRYLSIAKEALAVGSAGLAFDILGAGLSVFPNDREIRYFAALSLAKGGSTGHAARLLKTLAAEPAIDALTPEIVSLAGRVAKDRWSKLPPGPQRVRVGEEARALYRRAFELSHDPFPGINAATMYALTGERAEAVRLAREVRTLCTRRAERNDDLWLSATLGEASLLLGENGEAEHWYRKAAGMAGNRHGDMASMRRQVRLVAAQFPTAARLLDTLRVPRVAICTGHMIDAPDRAEPRFPKGAEPSARDAIARALAEENIGFGYSSAASGADILFAECMLERGAELNIVLPFHRDDFIRTSVAAAGPAWVERFEKVLAGATRVSHCVNEGYLGDDVLFDYAAELTQGLAALRSEHLETEAVMIALADVGSDEKLGGTLGSLRRWQNHGRATRILDLRELRSGAASGSVRTTVPLSTAPAESAALPWGQRQIRTMLFADVVGYSRLREEETPRFFVKFLGAVEREIQASATRPAFGNTWGDGLYLVFDHPGEGADFALRLRDAVATTDWASAGLPADLSLRIGMHTGPVFRGRDPIIRQESFFGAHVTRTARIEPVAAPGSVYLSEQMAAALAAAGETRFACDYLGALLLAKQFGTERLYRLRRTGEAD